MLPAHPNTDVWPTNSLPPTVLGCTDGTSIWLTVEQTVASGAAAPCGLSIARPVARPRAGWSAAGQGRSFGASGESFLRRRGVRTRPSGRAERFQCSQRCGWHLRVPGGVRLVGDDGY